MSSVNIPGYLLKDLTEALIHAFPSESKLQIMVAFQFDQNLNDIVASSSLQEMVYELIIHFQANNELKELIEKALEENKNNNELNQVAKKYYATVTLLEILEPLENRYFPLMREAYKACYLENSSDEWSENLTNLLQLFRKINDYSQNDYQKNLAKFVIYLLEKIPNPIVNQLKQWGKNYIGDNFDEQLDIINNPVKDKKEIVKTQPYLLVKLKISQQIKKKYSVSSWLITDTSNYDYLNNHNYCNPLKNMLDGEESENTSFNLKEIQKLLESFLEQKSQILKNYDAEPIIIFFLPIELLNYEIERDLSTQEDDLSIPIGSEYCVIFRSIKRSEIKYKHRGKWLEKWQRVKDNGEAICSQHLKFSEYEEWEDLFSYLEANNPVAIKLNTIPCDKIFKTLDRTAIPITLWLRKNDFEDSVCDGIQRDLNELLKCKINELPHQVTQLRLQAFPKTGKQEHIGHHLALLWEDPHLIPPHIEYTTP